VVSRKVSLGVTLSGRTSSASYKTGPRVKSESEDRFSTVEDCISSNGYPVIVHSPVRGASLKSTVLSIP
jgi:hypothetical protein